MPLRSGRTGGGGGGIGLAGLLQLALDVHSLLGRAGGTDERVEEANARKLEGRAVEAVQHAWGILVSEDKKKRGDH